MLLHQLTIIHWLYHYRRLCVPQLLDLECFATLFGHLPFAPWVEADQLISADQCLQQTIPDGFAEQICKLHWHKSEAAHCKWLQNVLKKLRLTDCQVTCLKADMVCMKIASDLGCPVAGLSSSSCTMKLWGENTATLPMSASWIQFSDAESLWMTKRRHIEFKVHWLYDDGTTACTRFCTIITFPVLRKGQQGYSWAHTQKKEYLHYLVPNTATTKWLITSKPAEVKINHSNHKLSVVPHNVYICLP